MTQAAASPTLRRDLLAWNALWIAAVLGSLLVLSLGWPELTRAMAAALIIMAIPAALSLIPLPTRWHDAGLMLALWALAGGAAAMLTGGVTGPLAPWCLAALAPAALLGRRRPMVLAAILSICAAAAAALVQLAAFTPAPAVEGLQIWLALIALISTAVGLAIASTLALLRRRTTTAAPAAILNPEPEAEPAPVSAPVEETPAAPTAPSVSEPSSEAPVEPETPQAGEVDAAQPGASDALLQAQPQLLLTLRSDGQIVMVFGETPEGMQRPEPGASLYDCASLASRPALIAAMRSAAQGERVACDFAPIGEPDRVCAASLKPYGDGVLATVHDVSQERWREAASDAARAEAEALNAGKSRFLANMSHELRTPLNAVIGFSDVMRARLFGDLPPRYHEYAEMIHESGRHLLDLINDVLDMSKIEAERYPLQREQFDVREAVSAALRLVRVQADTSGISLRGVLPPEPMEVDADRRALKQIVLNLTSNALKFTPRGGAVTVSVQAEGADLVVSVVDTGVGIAPEDLERLGRPYEQAGDAGLRAQGTGLGLSLVRAFAELHGGAMHIESVLSEGTRVIVRLPVVMPADRQDPTQPSGAQIIPFTR